MALDDDSPCELGGEALGWERAWGFEDLQLNVYQRRPLIWLRGEKQYGLPCLLPSPRLPRYACCCMHNGYRHRGEPYESVTAESRDE